MVNRAQDEYFLFSQRDSQTRFVPNRLGSIDPQALAQELAEGRQKGCEALHP